MTLDTKRLRELAEAATPGPWSSDLDQFDNDGPVALVTDDSSVLFAQLATGIKTISPERLAAVDAGEWTAADEAYKNNAWAQARSGQELKDAAFIAAANPQTIIALLDHLATITAERDELRDRLRGIHYSFRDLSVDCHRTFDGGYRTVEERDIFHHGMETVCKIVETVTARDVAELRKVGEL